MRSRTTGPAAVATLALAFALGATGCEPLAMNCDDLSGMLDGPGGLTVTEEEHGVGWGRSTCFSCHSVERMHVMNCTGQEEVDLVQIRTLVAEEEEASCARCHGENGVEP